MPDTRDRLHARDDAVAPDAWVDLSAARNAHPYPVRPIDPVCWQSGGDDAGEGALEAVAAEYYGNHHVVALAGEQAAIDTLPALFAPMAIACVTPADLAHGAAWARAGHKLRRLPTLARALAAATPNILIGNPDCCSASGLDAATLLDAAAALQRRGGFLIVDERFSDAEGDADSDADSNDSRSLAARAGNAGALNLLVLRSLDAFFGLAGARVAFVLAATDKLERLRQLTANHPLPPPSRAVARQALADTAWQCVTRRRLGADSRRLATALTPLGAVAKSALFCSVKLAPAHVAPLFEHFARRAILTHRFDAQGRVRFTVPRDEGQWRRLVAALADWTPPYAKSLPCSPRADVDSVRARRSRCR